MSTQNLWAKLVPLSLDKEPVNCDIESGEAKVEGKWKIYRRPTGETWITNLSPLYLKIGESWLGTNQEKQLLGGETLVFCQDRNEMSFNFDYVFCFTDLQSKNELKRNRENESSAEPLNQRSFEKLVKIDNSIQEADITCSICLGAFVRCATLGPCGHNLCGHCLIDHLKNSPTCPLCKKQIASVIKNSALCNIIETAVKNSPNLQRSSNEGIIPLQKDLEGNVNINGKEIFIGSVMNWTKEGQGTLVFPDGNIHQGVWKNGLREGEGIWILTDGTFLKGLWLHDSLQQTHVEIKYSNGNFYKGEINYTKFDVLRIHGRGILKYSHGETYEGDFKEDYLEGKGKYSYRDGSEYEGTFIKGERHGFGTLKFSDGNIYKGEWKKDKREGNGIQTYTGGHKFEGTFQNDGETRIGKYFWTDGSEYEGNLTHSGRNGNGTLKFLNGDIFKGEWKEDERHGKGVIIFKDAHKAEGDWINDILQPLAKIEYQNGNRYEGEVKDEDFEKHGKGVLSINIKGQYDGHWSQDKEIGQGKYTLEIADRKYEEFWEEGNVLNSMLTLANGTKFQATWKEVKEVGEKKVKGRKKKRSYK